MSDARDLVLDAGAGRTLPAHLVLPAGARPAARLPAVIVVHELMGLDDDIRRIAARFAAEGYAALAPDLVGPGWRPLCIARFLRGIGDAPGGRPHREMRAVHDWLAARPEVDAARVGMAGFCAGGGFAILYAARGGRALRAIAPFYGALPADETVIPELCPTVASYGGRDRVYGANGERLAAGLAAAGIPHDVRTYPGAGHSFMNRHTGLVDSAARVNPMRPGYDETVAEDAWGRVLAFFAEHLAPAPA